LRQMPPRSVRNPFPYLVRARQENPRRQTSPWAPIIASTTHASSNCKFLAPVLRACSSAHHTQEPGGCWWLPPFISRTAPSARNRTLFHRGILRPTTLWMPAPLPKLITFSAPAPTHQIMKSSPGHTFLPNEIRYLLILHQKCAIRGNRGIHILYKYAIGISAGAKFAPASLICSLFRLPVTT